MCPVRSASPSRGLAWQEQSMEITSDLLMPISKLTQVRKVPREGSLGCSISTLNIFSSTLCYFCTRQILVAWGRVSRVASTR